MTVPWLQNKEQQGGGEPKPDTILKYVTQAERELLLSDVIEYGHHLEKQQTQISSSWLQHMFCFQT